MLCFAYDALVPPLLRKEESRAAADLIRLLELRSGLLLAEVQEVRDHGVVAILASEMERSHLIVVVHEELLAGSCGRKLLHSSKVPIASRMVEGSLPVLIKYCR